ncbi:DsbA family oxidoreductase [Aestuariibius sp. HNIBRBA575]|uniref:DsbA family oxidoreductase n=1 Tax=Aestuariibius sp. HNIBRBA575 TaxID=3233343 RepID=UPI0034A512A6
MVKLDIISDPICPWCFIGKFNLDKALATLPEHPFTIEYHPFQLNPDMPAGGMDRRDYLETKFGGKEGAMRAYAPIVEMGEKLGMPLHLDKIQRTPNTMDAHRLIHWAGIEQKQVFVVQRLFDAYFTDGRDIGDHDVLSDIADSVDIDASMVRRLLASDADRDDIAKRDRHSREMGVQSVPTFIVANQHAVPGAQTTDMWIKVINDIMEQIEATT